MLEALREIHDDLVVLDCQMPQVDGYAATGAIPRLPGAERDILMVGTVLAAHPEPVPRPV